MDENNQNLITNSYVLVVDDDESVCNVLSIILEQQGFKVITANSGEDALKLFGDYLFDVVFTDIFMDGINGIELLSRITHLDGTIKTIIMTAHSGYDSAIAALKGGAHDYIEKPLTDHDRIAAIARKAHSHSMLERDNAELMLKLRANHAKLANANAQLIKLNEQLENLAVTDSLTGLKNRRFIDKMLAQEHARFTRYKTPFAILFIDVDRFKEFNDLHGHASGDQALRYIAKTLLENTRNTDTVGRYGGEEFVMILSDTDAEGASIVANRILLSIEHGSPQLNGKSTTLTVSIGISELTSDSMPAETAEILVQRADTALYESKHNGRNQFTVFNQNLSNEFYPDTPKIAVG